MSHTDTCLGKILAFQSISSASPELMETLRHMGDVTVVSGHESALAALERIRFDVVATAPIDYLDGMCGAAAGAQLGVVFDAIHQGICILTSDGQVIWSNTRLNELPAEVSEMIHRISTEWFASMASSPEPIGPRSVNMVVAADRCFDLTFIPLADVQRGTTRLAAVVSDVTKARRMQRKMDAIDHAGRGLVCVDPEQIAKMDARQRLELLENKIIHFTRELLAFDNFTIRLVDKRTNKLELVLCAGYPPEAQRLDIFVSTENSGVSGYVAATGQSYICPDVQNDPRYLLGINNARSSLTVPLCLHDKVIGIFNIESDKLAAFTEEDRQFTEIFGRYVAIALHILDLLVVERHATTGRLADSVTAEIAGPLGDILADATTLMEDYIGHDDLRHRLHVITDNVMRIKEAIKEVTQPTGGLLGAKKIPATTDPVLAGKSVLVIDDEEIIRVAVRDVLTKSGCEVEIARDGDEALAMIHRRSYDLIISDIRMPGHNGYEIYQEVKSINPACPVIFMTGFGYDPHHSIIRARQGGLAAVLYKPFKVDQLLNDVRAAVSASAPSS